ncbi:MAG: DUF1570 domain-containing protein [Planctomycetia bacterium]|nr:DUF1570 domain-containing protein [Planctomycetia bacterium]
MPHLPGFRIVTAAVVAVWLGHGASASEPSAPRERLEIRSAAGQRTVDAAVLVEAVDGGLLVELPDERYELLQPASIAARQPLPDAPSEETSRELGQRILADLPTGFDVLVTRHYVVCFDTSRDYAKWCAALFERLHEAFGNFWSKAGLDVVDPPRPLVVVIFADRRRYEAYASRDLGAATDRVVGYYNLLTNRVTTFDLTGTDGVPRPAGQASSGTAFEILTSPAAAGLVATLVHEATHQMAFNCGMHRRLAPVPLWVSEGIATYFETPDLDNTRGWRGIGKVNRPRLDHFLATHRAGDIATLIASDERFRAAEGPLDAYAAAWSLTRHLVETRKKQFVDYLHMQAAKLPLADDSAADRRREFEASFGQSPEEIEEEVVKAMARLASQR